MLKKFILPVLLLLNLNSAPSANTETIESGVKAVGDLQTVADNLLQVWPEKACAYHISQDTGYPLVSIACRGNFSATERRNFLDILYKNGYLLKNETYKLRDSSGTYLYKTSNGTISEDPIFFKVYVREATALYPQMPVTVPQIAIVVNELATEKELADWQSLGVPLTYSLAPFRNETAELRNRINEYGQEAWVTLRLEPLRSKPSDGKVLTLAEALNADEIENFANELNKSLGGEVKGFTYLLGSAFVKNIYALRALMSKLREAQITLFLEPGHERNAIETARIMSFHSFQNNAHFSGKAQQLQQQWSRILQIAAKNGYAIITVNANDQSAQIFLRNTIRADRKNGSKSIRFLRMSELPTEEN